MDTRPLGIGGGLGNHLRESVKSSSSNRGGRFGYFIVCPAAVESRESIWQYDSLRAPLVPKRPQSLLKRECLGLTLTTGRTAVVLKVISLSAYRLSYRLDLGEQTRQIGDGVVVLVHLTRYPVTLTLAAVK